jgi:DNA-binding transcriptional LysR family regulator
VKLFVRSHSGLRSTADGNDLMAQLEPLVEQLGNLEQRLFARPESVAGTVRITLADVFAVTLMLEFADYLKRHPAVRLEFLPDYRELDLTRGEADLAVRVTNHPAESLIGRKLGRYRMTVYASRRYLLSHDPQRRPEQCVWIESGIDRIRAAGFRNRYFPSMPIGSRCNSVLLQHAAVAADMGISLLPCAVGDADETLTRLDDVALSDAQEIWLLFHPDLRGVARIQSVSNHIQEAFVRLEPRLLGN